MPQTLKTVVVVDGPVRSVVLPSQSDPSRKHQVTFACDCEGFTFAGYCYHLTEGAETLRQEQTLLRNARKQRGV